MKLRRLVECGEIRVKVQDLGILDRLISSSFFLFFFLSLEHVDEAHRTASVCRRSHFGVEFFFIYASCRPPRRLDLFDLLTVRFVDHIAPVKRDLFSCRLYRSFFNSRSLCCRRFFGEFRFFYLHIFEWTDNRLFRPGHSGSAFAAELSALNKPASTITTEHYYLRMVYHPRRAGLTIFAHQKMCLFTIIQ